MPFHYRIACLLLTWFEEKWTENFENSDEINFLISITKGWSTTDWLAEQSNNSSTSQINSPYRSNKIYLKDQNKI